MKVLLFTLLLALLCSTQVLALKCFTCSDESDLSCKTETDCPESASFGKIYQKHDVFSRTCEQFCVQDYFTTCCQTDLC